ncbi:MAG: hypothetical protein FWF87_04090 [Synergistaceae bacterium]|nr:hypothetical protein [Synergistaceae bacterium]
MKNSTAVANISSDVINILGLGIISAPILFGQSNREHIEKNHPATFAKYSRIFDSVISSVLKNPDYVGNRDGAIEYVKIMPDGEILKVAVRSSKNGVYFARTMYPIQQEELDRFLSKNTLKKVSVLTKQVKQVKI